ncbi:MAG TPA: Smr/MutS family protein [Micropepsaceae bacterium]|nr:Smr/MutS family protein [Micropepsaceae bacterium]
MRKRREIHAEEHALWHHATRHVKPLKAKKVKSAPAVKAVSKPHTKPASKPAPAPLAPAPAPARPEKLKSAHSPRMDLTALDGTRAKKLKRGDLAIEDRIDLHGATEALAHRRLEEFVTRASKDNLRVVLVITGKGLGGRGVLRELVPRWLKEPLLRSFVVAMSPAAQRHGGDGALYLYLRRRARLGP